MTNHCVEMYNYHAWATGTILRRIKELPSTVLSEEVNSAFPTIGEVFSHMYTVEKSWLHVLNGDSMSKALEACLPLQQELLRSSVDEFTALFTELAEQFKTRLLEQDDLERTILLENPYAGTRNTRLSEIVLQVVNHATYHRGNVSSMLRQLGYPSVMTDYALYWYQGLEQS